LNLDDVKQNNLIDPNEESDDRRKKEKNSSLQINQKQSINERLGTPATTASNQQNILNRLQDNMSVDKTMTTTTSACSKLSSTEA
jgi:hypothetical protein